VTKLAVATLVVTIASLARAGAPAPAKPPAPDEIADIESLEANLESKARRNGLTFSFPVGFGITIGGDGIGRGPTLALRFGHVATRKTIITFELTNVSAFHKPAMMSSTLSDYNLMLMTGAQRYSSTTSSFWVRIAGGLSVLVKNANADGTGGDPPIGGVGGVAGLGADLARFDFGPLGYFVIGFETSGLASLSSDGLRGQLTFALSASLY
jgi:hypothetical protein